MSKFKRLPILVCIILVLSVTFIITSVCGADVTSLSGITTKDPRPNGCVDCHKGDTSIPAVVNKIENHPPVDKIAKTVPNDCFMCHKEDTKAGVLDVATHKQHFSNPEKNEFVTKYKGDCLNCHSLDMNTFKMGVKSGPANW
jgi:cytochrome c551/c552